MYSWGPLRGPGGPGAPKGLGGPPEGVTDTPAVSICSGLKVKRRELLLLLLLLPPPPPLLLLFGVSLLLLLRCQTGA